MPKSVPLRAIATTIVEPSMSARGVERQLAGGHREVEEEVVVAADEPQALRHVVGGVAGGHHRRGQVAQQHQRAGAVAVVRLVAHLQHLGEDPGDVDRPGRPHRVAEQRAEDRRHPPQPVEHLGPVGAVPQHLAEPLVERAVRAPSRRRVLEHEHPHRRRHHAGHRADRAAVVARLEGDRPRPPRTARRRRSGSSTSPSSAAAPMSAPRRGPEARSQPIGGPACRNSPGYSPSTSEAGATSTSIAWTASTASTARAFAVRGAAGRWPPWPGRPRCPPSAAASRRARPATAWPSTAAASRSAPAVDDARGELGGSWSSAAPRRSSTARRAARALDR